MARQSQLINISGLFEVTDGVYQIRNLDLSNMTIIEGKEDYGCRSAGFCGKCVSQSRMDSYFKNRGNKPAVANIYTHSHVDHYGGVRGVVDEADAKIRQGESVCACWLYGGSSSREYYGWQR